GFLAKSHYECSSATFPNHNCKTRLEPVSGLRICSFFSRSLLYYFAFFPISIPKMVPFLVGITKGFPVDLRVDIISETVQARIRMIPLLSCLSHILSLDPTGEDRKGEGLVALVEADVYLFRSVGCTFELFVYVLQNVSEG